MTVVLFYVYYFILAGMALMSTYGKYAQMGMVMFFVGVSFLAFYSGVLGPGVTQWQR